MNMIDMYLKINMCERDENNNVFFISENERKHIGKITGYKIEDGVLDVNIVANQNINFIKLMATITKDGVEFEK